jgi:hypothetical protein
MCFPSRLVLTSWQIKLVHSEKGKRRARTNRTFRVRVIFNDRLLSGEKLATKQANFPIAAAGGTMLASEEDDLQVKLVPRVAQEEIL